MRVPEEYSLALERCEKAKAEVIGLASSNRKWTMCIPAQQSDSDNVLMDALNDVPILLDRIAEMERRYEYAILTIRGEKATSVAYRDRAERAEAALKELRDHGVRCDLNPTIADWRSAGAVYDVLHGLLVRADRYVRDVARVALTGQR